ELRLADADEGYIALLAHAGRNCGSFTVPPSKVSRSVKSTCTAMSFFTASGSMPWRLDTRRTPSSSSTSATMRGASSGWVGWCDRIQLCTVPRPLDSWAVHSNDPQLGHMGDGGCCRREHLAHLRINSLPSFTPSQKNWSSWPTAGGTTFGISDISV